MSYNVQNRPPPSQECPQQGQIQMPVVLRLRMPSVFRGSRKPHSTPLFLRLPKMVTTVDISKYRKTRVCFVTQGIWAFAGWGVLITHGQSSFSHYPIALTWGLFKNVEEPWVGVPGRFSTRNRKAVESVYISLSTCTLPGSLSVLSAVWKVVTSVSAALATVAHITGNK